MAIVDDSVVKLCQRGIFPKLNFLLETRDSKSLETYFESPPRSHDEAEGQPLSLPERVEILKTLLSIAQSREVKDWWCEKLGSKSRAIVVIFLSENHDGTKPWSNEECQRLVSGICENLISRVIISDNDGDGAQKTVNSRQDLSAWFHRNFEDCSSPNQSDFFNIVQMNKIKFSKQDWKYYSINAHGFSWIIRQIRYPFLTTCIDLVIPPTLLFVDDYYDDHKTLGLLTLSYIVQNVDKRDLSRNNWAHVIYDAVITKMSEKDSEILTSVIEILEKVLAVLDKNPAECSSEFTKYDEVLKKVIFEVEMCSDVRIKSHWFLLLDTFLKKMGPATIHWSDKLCSMLRDSTVSHDYTMWYNILQVTSTIIKNTWMKADCLRLGEIVLRTLFNCACFDMDESKHTHLKLDIIQNAKYCFELLQKCDEFSVLERQIEDILTRGESTLLHPEFIKILQTVLSASDKSN